MTAPNEYVPSRGEITYIFLEFVKDARRRPRSLAAALSSRSDSATAGRLLLCPIAGRASRDDFDVPLPADGAAHAVVRADQVHSWTGETARRSTCARRPPPSRLR